MKYKTILLFFIVFSLKSIAQPTIKDYEDKTIYAVAGKFQIGKKPITLKEMIAEINSKSKEGAMFATDGYMDFKKSKIYSGISLGLSLGALIFLSSGTLNRKQANIGLGLTIGSFIPAHFGGRFRKSANEKITKAIWLYNRDILFTPNN